MKKQKNYPLNPTVKIESIAHMLELCAKDAGNKTAFMYKENSRDSIHEVTYRFFNHTLLNTKHGLVFDSVGDNEKPPATIAPTMHFIILSSR